MTEELNRRHNLATIPTINNNGESYIVPFDIYKEGYDAYDISNWFKGRVGDNGTPFGIRWYKHGQLMDVTGMRPFIEGQVGDYTIDDSDPDDPKINMDSEASNVHVVGDVNDCQEYGVAIYRLINQAMPQSGIFYGKIGVMGTQDDGTTVMSSVDVVFKVLAGHMSMVGARKFYVSELEKALLDFKAKIKQHDQEYATLLEKHNQEFQDQVKKNEDDFNSHLSDELKHIHDQYQQKAQLAQDSLDVLQREINEARNTNDDLSITIKNMLANLRANNIVTLPEWNKLKAQLTDYVSSINIQPETYSTLADVAAKYPKGSNNLIVTADGHKAIWKDGKWQDGGNFISPGLTSNSVNYDNLTTLLQSLFTLQYTPITQFNWKQGFFSRGAAQPTTDYPLAQYDELAVKAGDEFTISGIARDDMPVFAVTNPKGEELVSYPAEPTKDDEIIENYHFAIPSGGTKLYVNQATHIDNNHFALQKATGIILSGDQNVNIDRLEKTLKDSLDYVYSPVDVNWTSDGFFSATTGILNKGESDYKYALLNVVPGEHYIINGYARDDLHPYVITDSDNNVLATYPTDNVMNDRHIVDHTFTIPENGTQLKISDFYNDAQFILQKATGINFKLDPNSVSLNELNSSLQNAFIPTWTNINLNWQNGGFYSKSAGVLISNAAFQWAQIPVVKGDTYRINGTSLQDMSAFLLKDKAGLIKEIHQFTEPVNAVPLVDFKLEVKQDGTLYLNRQINTSFKLEKLNYLVKSSNSSAVNKKWGALGDSLTDIGTLGADQKNYVDFVSQELGLEATNLGVGGSGYLRANDPDHPDRFYNREISGDYDVITIFGSFNDTNVANATIGSQSTINDKSTLWGAVTATLQNIWNANDQTVIGIITPTPWVSKNYQQDIRNGINGTIKCVDYVNALKDIAKYYSIPLLNLFDESNLRPWDESFKNKYFHNQDGIHPLSTGHQLFLAPKICDFIKSLM